MSLYVAGYMVFFVCLNMSFTSFVFAWLLWFFMLIKSLSPWQKSEIYYLLSLPIPGLVTTSLYAYFYAGDMLDYYSSFHREFLPASEYLSLFNNLVIPLSNLGLLGVVAPITAVVLFTTRLQDPILRYLCFCSLSLLGIDIFFLLFHWHEFGFKSLHFASFFLPLLVCMRLLNWRRKTRLGSFFIKSSLFVSCLLLAGFYFISLGSPKSSEAARLFFGEDYPQQHLGVEAGLAALLDRELLPIVVVDPQQVYPSYYHLRKLGLNRSADVVSLMSLKPSPEAKLWQMLYSTNSEHKQATTKLESLTRFYLLDTHLLDWSREDFGPRAYQNISSHSCQILHLSNNEHSKTQVSAPQPLIYVCQKSE